MAEKIRKTKDTEQEKVTGPLKIIEQPEGFNPDATYVGFIIHYPHENEILKSLTITIQFFYGLGGRGISLIPARGKSRDDDDDSTVYATKLSLLTDWSDRRFFIKEKMPKWVRDLFERMDGLEAILDILLDVRGRDSDVRIKKIRYKTGLLELLTFWTAFWHYIFKRARKMPELEEFIKKQFNKTEANSQELLEKLRGLIDKYEEELSDFMGAYNLTVEEILGLYKQLTSSKWHIFEPRFKDATTYVLYFKADDLYEKLGESFVVQQSNFSYNLDHLVENKIYYYPMLFYRFLYIVGKGYPIPEKALDEYVHKNDPGGIYSYAQLVYTNENNKGGEYYFTPDELLIQWKTLFTEPFGRKEYPPVATIKHDEP